MESLSSKIGNQKVNQEPKQPQQPLELTRRLVESQSRGMSGIYRQISESNISINRLFENNEKNQRNEPCVHLKNIR